jgi:AraC-like DNA-binding protein
LDGVAMSRVAAPAVRVTRTKALLGRNPIDHWVLTYCKHGAMVIRTSRSELYAPAGVPFLWSLGEPSVSRRTDVDRVQLFLSRERFRDIGPLLDAARGSTLETPLGQLLGDFMVALDRRLPALTVADTPRLTAAIGTLIAACVAPSAERLGAARAPLDLGRLERVRQAIRKHLRSPTLTPAALSRMVGVSRSGLYRLFEVSGGVAHYILRQRLLEAHAILSNSAIVRPIAAIAEDLCFADASSFSRAFRKEFGCSPGDVRGAALAGLPPPSVPRRSRLHATHFGDLLGDI